LHQKEDPG